jgi:hypothetical protein
VREIESLEFALADEIENDRVHRVEPADNVDEADDGRGGDCELFVLCASA